MTGPSDISIEFSHVDYAPPRNRELVYDLNFAVRTGEVLVLLGKSGSGKTTTLKLINRLLTPTRGDVRVEGQTTHDWNVIELRRKIGFAVQDVGLFPHYTAEENVGVLLRAQGMSREKVRERVQTMLSLVGLPYDQFARRYPHQLSGGQRQRVGLARALAADPPILLMDEPFGALDPVTRVELQREFSQLRDRLGKTVVFVTHDVAEALTLGHRIALLETGRLLGIYTPHEFLRSPNQDVTAYRDAYRSITQALGS